MELVQLRRRAAELSGIRDERLRELGEAAYEGNRAATKELKVQVKNIDHEIRAKEEEMAKVAMTAQERIGRAHLQVQPTQILPQDEETPGQTPEPAQVPEPYPPPGEGERASHKGHVRMLRRAAERL